jgi:hypothetical protein
VCGSDCDLVDGEFDAARAYSMSKTLYSISYINLKAGNAQNKGFDIEPF